MIKVYKHISEKYAQMFQSGESIQLGTFESYRKGESDRADPLEGKTEYHVNYLEPAFQYGIEFADIREAVGLPRDMSNFQNFIFQNNTIRYVLPPAYLFCCSLEPDFSRRALGEVIFEISDLDLLAHRLTMARRDLLCEWSAGPVTYEQRSVDPFLSGTLRQSPFRKDQRFMFENEFRIVWRLKSEPQDEYLRIECPKVHNLIKFIK